MYSTHPPTSHFLVLSFAVKRALKRCKQILSTFTSTQIRRNFNFIFEFQAISLFVWIFHQTINLASSSSTFFFAIISNICTRIFLFNLKTIHFTRIFVNIPIISTNKIFSKFPTLIYTLSQITLLTTNTSNTLYFVVFSFATFRQTTFFRV